MYTKEVKMNSENVNFTEQDLQKLNIHELRRLAREIGLASPTVLKKEEIITKILGIVFGTEQKPQTKSLSGRPAKEMTKPSRILYELETKGGGLEWREDKKETTTHKVNFGSNEGEPTLDIEAGVASSAVPYKSERQTARENNKQRLKIIEKSKYNIDKIIIGENPDFKNKNALNMDIVLLFGEVVETENGKEIRCVYDGYIRYFKLSSYLEEKYNLAEGDIVEVWVDLASKAIVNFLTINDEIVV